MTKRIDVSHDTSRLGYEVESPNAQSVSTTPGLVNLLPLFCYCIVIQVLLKWLINLLKLEHQADETLVVIEEESVACLIYQ